MHSSLLHNIHLLLYKVHIHSSIQFVLKILLKIIIGREYEGLIVLVKKDLLF